MSGLAAPVALAAPAFVLTLNAGSSSLKYAVFALDSRSDGAILCGSIDRASGSAQWLDQVLHHTSAVTAGAIWAGIGHRIVHGGPHLSEPQLVKPPVMAELQRIIAFAPEHLPAEIALIEDVTRQFPAVPQVVCFDTAFHRDLPRVAQLLPIPRHFEATGIRRYGFHGLSYEFLREQLVRLNEPAIRHGKVILAHLGNGASLAALRDGVCVDTSMGFTPAAGLVMGSRAGDLDPGLIAYLAQTETMTAERLNHLVNHESGLLGVSETSADMRALLGAEECDVRAAEAVALFCQQAKKWLGAYAAVLGGLDTLVFAGGIGENNAPIRARICRGLEFLGLELDDTRNASHAPVISAATSRVSVRVIPTNEELIIARAISQVLRLSVARQRSEP